MAVEGDTIFALATPPGVSAIAIIRISGGEAARLGYDLSGYHLQHKVVQAAIIRDEEGLPLDEAMLLYMKAPATPTGEECLEIHCHGSLAVTSAIIGYLARQEHCRPAEAGEFSKRAFDNGKMDLTAIEGLADLIEAQTQTQRLQAFHQLKGALRNTATNWRDNIIQLSARLEALIDFADEELPQTVKDEISALKQSLSQDMQQALGDDGRGEVIRQGLVAVLMGPVNAGKSTALNALAGRPAAIVSDEAGTTRDIVEVRLDIGGVPVSLLDTAGIRDTTAMVEQIGIERAKQAADDADVIVVILDGSDKEWQKAEASLAIPAGKAVIKILNKADKMTAPVPDDGYIALSLKNEAGIKALETALASFIIPLNQAASSPIITRARHRQLIEKAAAALQKADMSLLDEAPELIAEDLREAADALGQMTGQIDVEDILGDIFSSFCIGK